MMKDDGDQDIALNAFKVKTIAKHLPGTKINMYLNDETKGCHFNTPGIYQKYKDAYGVASDDDDDLFGPSTKRKQGDKSEIIPGLTKNEVELIIAYYGSI